MMKKLMIGFSVWALVAAVFLGPAGGKAFAADVIKWGVLIDLSGPTSDWGKNQVKGQLDAMRWVNGHGGINGKDFFTTPIDWINRTTSDYTFSREFRSFCNDLCSRLKERMSMKLKIELG